MRDRVLALPDPGVHFRALRQVLAADLVEGRGEPRVLPPIEFYDLCAVRRIDAEALVRRRIAPLGVPGYPNFRALFADGRDRLEPGRLGYRLGLIDPEKADAGGRFDAFNVPAKADKGKVNPAVFRPDVFLADLVMRRQPGLALDRRLDLGHRAVVERILKFSAADDDAAFAGLGAAQAMHG